MNTAALTQGLEGRWELVRAQLDGVDFPELPALKITLDLEGGAYRVRLHGKVSDCGHLEVGRAGPVGTITIRGVEGPNAGRTIPCIYQQAGNRLRVCYGLGGDVPSDFKTQPGQKRYLATYRRSGTGE